MKLTIQGVGKNMKIATWKKHIVSFAIKTCLPQVKCYTNRTLLFDKRYLWLLFVTVFFPTEYFHKI